MFSDQRKRKTVAPRSREYQYLPESCTHSILLIDFLSNIEPQINYFINTPTIITKSLANNVSNIDIDNIPSSNFTPRSLSLLTLVNCCLYDQVLSLFPLLMFDVLSKLRFSDKSLKRLFRVLAFSTYLYLIFAVVAYLAFQMNAIFALCLTFLSIWVLFR